MSTMAAISAQAAESIFYTCFENGDLDAMMEIWDATPDIVCVHPMGASLMGVEAVRDSWRQILEGDGQMKFTTHIIHRFESDNLSVHHLYEEIAFGQDFSERSFVIATNIYRRTPQGWRIVAHHGSPGRLPAAPKNPPSRAMH
ncbi:MAG: SnoaL-like domain-containing protein [Chromatiales bacterium]|jgi:ketosteroid isomerase-like protein|nr:SnoaL-like domain-containing protein [Chromatiales bacterium]